MRPCMIALLCVLWGLTMNLKIPAKLKRMLASPIACAFAKLAPCKLRRESSTTRTPAPTNKIQTFAAKAKLEKANKSQQTVTASAIAARKSRKNMISNGSLMALSCFVRANQPLVDRAGRARAFVEGLPLVHATMPPSKTPLASRSYTITHYVFLTRKIVLRSLPCITRSSNNVTSPRIDCPSPS